MDPLDLADPGSLGTAVDGIIGTVKSVKELGRTVVEDTSFELVLPVVWALFALIALSRILKFTQPWSEAGAKRYSEGHKVITFKTPKAYEAELKSLRDQLAGVLAELTELKGADAPQQQGDVHVEANQGA